MAPVPKRTRYEVLRRDQYTCRYCGAKAPDVRLNVDAVVPEVLGGNHKDPANLVTACEACNNGKSSSHPDAPLVSEVADDAVRWGLAMRAAADRMLADLDSRQGDREQFREWWNEWGAGEGREWESYPIDPDWKTSVDQLLAAGLPLPILKTCIDIAMRRKKVAGDRKFRYMCGVAWQKVQELRERASELLRDGVGETDGDDEGDREDLDTEAIDNWCRIILKQRDIGEVEKAARDNFRRAGDDSLNGILWYVIHNMELDRVSLYATLRQLLEQLPDEIGIDLIREQEAHWLERLGPSGRYTSLVQAADETTYHFALVRASQELAAMPVDEAEAWVQCARDENAYIAEHLDEDYYRVEGARLAREALAGKGAEAKV